MKNFIWVINKEKIYAYVLSVVTVAILFVMSTMINKNFDNSELTSSNIVENINVTNELKNEQNMETEETVATENALVPNN